jgi:iron complex outermembrane recepter protein
MKKTLLQFVAICFLCIAMQEVNAQTTVTGSVIDGESGEGLPGANVLVKGTSLGTITDLNGAFSLPVGDRASVTLVITFIGFKTQEKIVIPSEKSNVGTIALEPGAQELSPLEIMASVAVDRKTPVAVSTIKRAYIEENASNQEFPELLKSTPGVYATKTGGGYGDSRINVRGFNSVNVAVLINGVPVNDMENGRVYWSNWAGLTDVTTNMQVQRGLGASKVAVPSIGGTINILTKTTDANQGGFVFQGYGNNGYKKTSFSYSTGLLDNDWAVSISAAKIEGEGWADGTQFLGYNYFFNVSKMIGDNHTISLTGFGAPQWHGQRQNKLTIDTYRDAPQGLKYNSDWGYKNGQVVNVEDNFYHKPQFSLNHYWAISSQSELATAVYASTGTGGGGGYQGTLQRSGGQYGPYDLDATIEQNLAASDGNALAYLRASRNDHRWYGILSTYTNQISSKFNLLGGIDARYYKGIHFSEVTDLLGAQYVLDNKDLNNPNRALKVGDKRDYYNDGIVLWEGFFLQGEYTDGPLSAFVSLSGSNTSYQRIDYYQYVPSEQKTDFQNFLGFQAKGGVNYNLNKNHNVFANLGYFQKAPDFDAVFQNFKNDINADAVNQKILSYELGYGYRNTNFNANVNVYRTSWNDRTFTKSFQGSTPGELYFANILGVDALHQGLELDFLYKPFANLSINGMLSLGNWEWKNDVDGVNIFDENQTQVGSIKTLYMGGLKVGDAAQTTSSIGMDYKIVKQFKIGFLYNYYANLYAEYDPTNRTKKELAGVQAWKVPDYGLLDLKAVMDFKLGSLAGMLYINVNNVFDTEYITDAQDGDGNEDGIGDALGSSVFYGVGRTWTTSIKINF